MASDILIAGSYGLIMPILPLFMTDRISGADLQSVAVAAAIYLLAQAGFSWIFSSYLHHKHTAQRAHGGLVVGSLIVALVPAAYLIATDIVHIYLAQIGLGLGFGLIYPAWTWLANEQVQEPHAKSVKKIHDMFLSLTLAFFAVLGGFVAYRYGYTKLIYLMTALGACGTLLSLTLLFEKKTRRRT